MKKIVPVIFALAATGCVTKPVYENFGIKNSKPIATINETERFYLTSDLEKIAVEENRIHWNNNFYVESSNEYVNEGLDEIRRGLKNGSVIFIYDSGFEGYLVLKYIKDVKIKTHIDLKQNTIEINQKDLSFNIRNNKGDENYNYGEDGGFYRTNQNP